MKKFLIYICLLFALGCQSEQTKSLSQPSVKDKETVIEPQTNETQEQMKLSKTNTELTTESKNQKNQGIIPIKIEIPAINVATSVEHVGVLDNGAMDVPKNDENVGWFQLGYKPGDQGNSVMAGHVDNKQGPAVFYQLPQLKVGDTVLVTDVNGITHTFIVKKLVVYPEGDAPIEEIFGSSSSRNLNLITCSGTFDKEKQTYLERLVVFTVLEEG